MGFEERWAKVVESVGCDVCHVEAGSLCLEGDNGMDGHGARLDAFCADAPYEARLFVHLDTRAEHGFHEHTLFLTRKELEKLSHV